jgi:hypothetical protein
MKTKTPSSIFIAHLGGLAVVAGLFGIRVPSVQAWKAAGIPPARLQTLQAWARLPARWRMAGRLTSRDIADALKAAGLDAESANK